MIVANTVDGVVAFLLIVYLFGDHLARVYTDTRGALLNLTFMRAPHERPGGSRAAVQGLVDVGVVVVVVVALEDDDDEVDVGGQDVGGLLCGVVVGVVLGGCCVGVCSTDGCCSGVSGLASGLRASRTFEPLAEVDVDTVMMTVDVLPSGAVLTEVCTTSALGLGRSASLVPPEASIDASVANNVATTTPPAASSTTEDTFFFGDSG